MLAIVTFGATAVLLFQTPTKYGSDRFRQIFIDPWEKWWDYRREEIPADQRAYVLIASRSKKYRQLDLGFL